MEEYRVKKLIGSEAEEYLNKAASEGWMLAAATGAGDSTSTFWVILRRQIR